MIDAWMSMANRYFSSGELKTKEKINAAFAPVGGFNAMKVAESDVWSTQGVNSFH